MGYMFFSDGIFPTCKETAHHFQDVFYTCQDEPDLAKQFYDQVLKPFRDAMLKFRMKHEHFPWNPFIGGIFTEINGISIWNTLLETKHLQHRRLLLGILLFWGFGNHNEHGWTIEKEDLLMNELENTGVLDEVRAFDAQFN